MWPMGPHHFGGGWGLLGLFGVLLNLGLLVGVVLLVLWLVRRGGSGARHMHRRMPGADLTPRDILQRRYASGEITREQYREMLADLGMDGPGEPPPPPPGV